MFEKLELNETKRIRTEYAEELKRKAQENEYLTKKTHL